MSATVAWVTVADTDLDTYLTGIKTAALRETALAEGQTDPFDDSMRDVVNRIRNKIKSNPTNRVSATALTIPPELKTAACWLTLEAMNARIGLSRSIQLTEDQKTLIKKFEKDLEDVVTGDFSISNPIDPEDVDVQRPGITRVVSSSERVVTRSTMNGL